jgi:hypothetical protein
VTRRRQRIVRSATRHIHDDAARDQIELEAQRSLLDRGGDTPEDWRRTWGIRTETK